MKCTICKSKATAWAKTKPYCKECYDQVKTRTVRTRSSRTMQEWYDEFIKKDKK